MQQALKIALETYLFPMQRTLTVLPVKAIDLSTRARNVLECQKTFSLIISSLFNPMYKRSLKMACHSDVIYVSRVNI